MVFGDSGIPLGRDLIGKPGFRGFACTCPTCGEAWARVGFPGRRGKYTILALPCGDHGEPFRVGGSILAPLAWWGTPIEIPRAQVLAIASPGLVSYEALMLAQHILKDIPQ